MARKHPPRKRAQRKEVLEKPCPEPHAARSPSRSRPECQITEYEEDEALI